jgi:hypothetical protein
MSKVKGFATALNSKVCQGWATQDPIMQHNVRGDIDVD